MGKSSRSTDVATCWQRTARGASGMAAGTVWDAHDCAATATRLRKGEDGLACKRRASRAHVRVRMSAQWLLQLERVAVAREDSPRRRAHAACLLDVDRAQLLQQLKLLGREAAVAHGGKDICLAGLGLGAQGAGSSSTAHVTWLPDWRPPGPPGSQGFWNRRWRGRDGAVESGRARWRRQRN